MKLAVQKIERGPWEKFCAAPARAAVFSERVPPEYDRVDYGLLVVDRETETPLGYATVRELDADSAYLKHGGAFPTLKGGYNAMAAYRCLLSYLEARYKRLTTLVANTNTVYLKMALTVGFKVIGVRLFKGTLLVELFKGIELCSRS